MSRRKRAVEVKRLCEIADTIWGHTSAQKVPLINPVDMEAEDTGMESSSRNVVGLPPVEDKHAEFLARLRDFMKELRTPPPVNIAALSQKRQRTVKGPEQVVIPSLAKVAATSRSQQMGLERSLQTSKDHNNARTKAKRDKTTVKRPHSSKSLEKRPTSGSATNLTPTVPEIVSILNKPETQRTPDEVKRLFAGLRTLKAFSAMSDFTMTQLLGVIHPVLMEQNRTVFRQGDIGSSWFVILEGTVDILVLKGGTKGLKNANDAEGNALAEMDVVDVVRQSIVLKSLEAGAGFGELALSHITVRSATIKTVTSCVLLKIEKADYLRVVRFVHEKERQERILYLRRYVGITDEREVNLIANAMAVVRYPKGTYVLKQGATVSKISFLKSGVLAAFTHLEVTTEEAIKLHLHRHAKIRPPHAVRARTDSGLLEDAQVEGPCCIAIFLGYISPGEYFGEQIMWNGGEVESDNNVSTVTATTTTAVAPSSPATADTPAPPTTGSSSSSTPRTLPSPMTIHTLTEVTLGEIQEHDARERLASITLPLSPLTKMALSRDAVLQRHFVLTDRRKWDRFRQREMDKLVREVSGDVNMDLRKWGMRMRRGGGGEGDYRE
ncbi:uncharacterized protein EV422DRAFT_566842 [Fimicolochytrium jonesii]|uniref:uncharacterized protein n=1 Tax=Fimicolochytrium jonesii TaxID=1396493 RepID=UPI0022FDBBCD|nr:uncharacterized protein EV422DRAFT_566842 [Fimicolochytrium jonesii]KAI8821762.1 hypothetical protein EV422DRAFT_566842 [Fimicolochytrium jonesii]